jgi:amino acid adenylation domain-containing protein
VSTLQDHKLVEDVYPLTPMQRGMMFHTLREPGSGVYVEQIRLELQGLDPALFRVAWEHMLARHAALRTSIVGTGGERPAQVVRRQVELPWREHDLRDLASDAERQAWLATFLDQDGARGFGLGDACLVRFDLMRTGETAFSFVWTLHHIALDGWSGAVVLRDAFRCYHALRRGQSPDLPEARPFRAFLEWLQGRDDARAEAWWRAELADAPRAELPGDQGTRDAAGSIGSYTRLERTLDGPRLEALRRRAGAARVSLGTLLQGAWALALARSTGSHDVIVGTVTSGRPEELPGVEDMVGMFVNTLPLRVRLDDDASLDAWLAALQSSQADRREHEHSPLWLVQQWAGCTPGEPLFENLAVIENYPVDPEVMSGGDGLDVRVTPPFDRTGYPLMLLATPGESLQLQLTHDAERFSAQTAEGLLDRLEAVLADMAGEDVASVGELGQLAPDERERVVVQWNRTETTYPTDRRLHELVLDQARATPDALAVVHGERALSYAQLVARSQQLARHLQELGVAPGARVGVCAERSLEMIVGVVGVLSAGAAYVPLDPAHPAERRSAVLADAGIEVVVAHEPTRDLFGAPGPTAVAGQVPCAADSPAGPDAPPPARAVCLDRDRDALAALPTEPVTLGEHAGDLAYVLYTSGSTGRPKGVAMPHAPLVNLMHWQREQSGPGEGAVTLQFSPLVFDVSCQEIFATLGTGGTLCLLDDETRRDPAALLDLIARRDVSRLFQPFVALQQLATEAVAQQRFPTSLSEVITAGEQLVVSPAVLAFFERLPGCRLVNQYGPTECHVVSSFTLQGAPDSWPRLPPIGRPIANARLYVLDQRLRPVPVGVAGELCIGGAALAQGYLGDAARTAEVFIDDPFGTSPGSRMYRTGDRARFLESGDIEYLGRMDRQVKLRGFRLELGEVEAVATELAGVDQAVAVVREDRPGDRRLVLCYVGGGVAPAELRAHLERHLPAESVPSGVLSLETLPTTATGKLDRQALLSAGYAPDELRGSYVPPRGPVEQMLSELWAEVLGVDAPGAHDDFFDLGGHSLSATRLMSRVREALRVELPLRALFEAPTIAGLAQAVADLGDGRPERGTIECLPHEGDQPLSFSQQRLWFLDQVGTDAAYNMPWAFRLSGPLDGDALERSLQTIVGRHDSLRTLFVSKGGEPARRVLPELLVPLRRVDLSALDDAARDDELARLAALEAETPFDLERGPLFRPALVRLAETEHVLFLSMHHIVFDGWSIGILNRELLECYRAERAGEAPRLPELSVHYGDFVAWQARWLSGDVLNHQLAYWSDKLGGRLPVLELPTDRLRPELQTYRGGGHRLYLDPVCTRALGVLSRRRGVTLAVTVLAAFKLLLSRYTGLQDILVGTPIANRTERSIEDLIGFFVNTLVLRSDLSGDPTFLELLERVHVTALDAYEHQDLPFERLVDELQPVRDPSRNPIFQVVFAMQNATRDPLLLPDLEVSPLGAATRATRFDLELHVGESPDGLDLGFCYNRDLFDHGTIERMGEHFAALLRGIAEDPARPLSRLPLLPESERQQLLAQASQAPAHFDVDGCLHQRFAEQAARTPDALALTCEGETLTYAELERRANRLAHVLVELGVGPGVLVGLCLERGLDLPLGVLGVLKAGGCYVPLDLANPTERIAFILKDTDVPVLVTESAQLERLPEHGAQVVCLDRDRARLDAAPEHAPDVPSTPDDLAYVIYTSGSTGAPKGVQVAHRSVLRLFEATAERCGFGPDDVSTLFHSCAFDFSVWELWGALLYGGRLVVVPYMLSRSPDEFLALLEREGVTVLSQTPTAFRSLIASDLRPGADHGLALRLVIFGGEALDPPMLAPWFERHGDERPALVNMYGITETTVHVTWRRLRAADLGVVPGSMLGQPLPDLSLHILDPHGELVPVGVPGELHVGGAGVSRGYLRRDELTAQRFLPDPFAAEPGARLYRTGDLGRRLANGDVQYLGRNDEQVQLRGYRIELGEIEAALVAHPWVASAVVTLPVDEEGEPRLVGYVVPEASETDADAGEIVSQWESLYDDTYTEDVPGAQHDFHIVGWNSSYTGQPLPAADMAEWVDETVGAVLAARPERVLEIGCGTGLLLFRIAPSVARYVATDLSRSAIEHVGSHLEGELAERVELHHGTADRLPEGLEAGFDAVILNSVIQYFPSMAYLAQVLEQAVAATADGGQVHVGDVRHLGLLPAYHGSVQLHQAERDMPLDRLASRYLQRLAQEEELVVDPAFFLALGEQLARVGRVEITPKRAAARNELSDFRYQVTLHVAAPSPADAAGADPAGWQEWDDEALHVDALAQRLRDEQPAWLGLRNVPNLRTVEHAAVATRLSSAGASRTGSGERTAGRLRTELASADRGRAVDPHALVALEGSLPYRVVLDWGSPHADGAFDALFLRQGGPAEVAFPRASITPRPWADYGNQPLQARMTRQLAPRLREWLEQRVPAYMVPSAFVMLGALPLTANGKVDRRRLPDPDWFLSSQEGEREQPHSETEAQLAAIWGEFLGLDQVGTADDFFDLGGHSLLAAQVVSRIRDAFGVEVGLRQFFELPTVSELSAHIDELAASGSAADDDRETGEL